MLLGALLASSFLAGCGGGGDSSSTTAGAPAPIANASAEGVYGGTITGSKNTSFETIILENGDFWSIYGTETTSSFNVTGFLQGSGTSDRGSFNSVNAKDFGFAPGVAGNLSSTYDATAKTISGTFAAGTQVATFSGGPIAGSLYNYNTPASLSTVIGTWSTSSLPTGENVAINVASDGAFNATSSLGCKFAGNITPRASGKNVFDVAMTFGAAPCALSGQSATGIALSYPLPSGKTELLVTAVNGARSYGAAVFGTR
jgi:hypothetical protein